MAIAFDIRGADQYVGKVWWRTYKGLCQRLCWRLADLAAYSLPEQGWQMNQSSSTIKRKNQMHTRNNKNSRPQLLRQLAPALAVAIAAYMVPFSALAQSPTTTATAGKMEMGTNSDASMKMRKSMEDMQQKMAAMPATGNPDINFAMMMVAHHQGAIDMAQAEIDTGKDPAMIKAAKKIISAQKKEIAQFEAWLKKNPHPMK